MFYSVPQGSTATAVAAAEAAGDRALAAALRISAVTAAVDDVAEATDIDGQGAGRWGGGGVVDAQ